MQRILGKHLHNMSFVILFGVFRCLGAQLELCHAVALHFGGTLFGLLLRFANNHLVYLQLYYSCTCDKAFHCGC